MQAQDPHYAPAVVAMAVADPEATADEAAVLENEDMGVDAADYASRIHQDAPIAVWTTTPPKSAERHPNRLTTPPVWAVENLLIKLLLLRREWTLSYELPSQGSSKGGEGKETQGQNYRKPNADENTIPTICAPQE